MRRAYAWAFLLILFPAIALAQVSPRDGSRSRKSVTSTSVAVEIFPVILTSAHLYVPDSAVTSVYICEISSKETCASVTTPNGCYELFPGQHYAYSPGEWGGGACGLLRTGSTAVSVDVTTK